MLVDDNRTVMMDFVLKELKKILTTLVVKLDYIAKACETEESATQGDLYCAAMIKADTFYSYIDYSYELMIEAGIPEDIANNCIKNPSRIPIKYREKVLELRRAEFFENFVEKNEYYRMLNGQPPLEDKEFIYIEEEVEGVDKKNPVHLMSKTEIMLLELEGLIDKLIIKYPEKRYLRHLRAKKIPIEIARRASAYNIMYIERDLSDPSFLGKFVRLYTESKEYTLKKIYDKAYKIQSDYYESFIGIFILSITAQRFITNYFKSGIERDFYDKDLIKFLFESYGLPFYNEISLNYLRNISKNLNKLLMYKATDKVFIDIFKLFNMKNIEVYKYYLLKDRKTDYFGNPVFKYRINKEGEVEEDLEKNYTLKFVQVPRDSTNLALDLMNTANYLDYDMVTNMDYLWGDDGEKEDFTRKVLDAEYNYIQTKYISINSKYEITRLTYEICYFYRMMVESAPAQEFLSLEIRFVNKPCQLFHIIITLFALVCKKMGFDGNIMDTTSKVMSIYGFNFNTDFDYITKIIETHDLDKKDWYKREDYELTKPPEKFDSPKEILDLFKDNTRLYDLLKKRRYEATNIKEYNAYKRLYDALFVTKYTTDMYRDKETNELPSTYEDYLLKNNIDLYQFIKETDDENFVERIDAVLYGLETYFNSEIFENLFINIPSLSADNIRKFIFYLIDIFKSYTVDLTAMNIIYHIDDKTMHNIKTVHDVIFRKSFTEISKIDIKDIFEEMEKNLVIGTKIVYNYRTIIDSLQQFITERKVYDKPFDFFQSNFELATRLGMDFKDIFDEVIKNVTYEEKLEEMTEEYKLEKIIEVVYAILIKETLDFSTTYIEERRLEPEETLFIKAKFDVFDSIVGKIWDEIVLVFKLNFDEKLKFKSFLKFLQNTKTIGMNMVNHCNDLLDIDNSVIEQKDNVEIKERLSIIREVE